MRQSGIGSCYSLDWYGYPGFCWFLPSWFGWNTNSSRNDEDPKRVQEAGVGSNPGIVSESGDFPSPFPTFNRIVMRAVIRFIAAVLVVALAACGANDRVNGFVWAAHEGDIPKVKQLLGDGVDINSKAFDDGQTELIAAVRAGQSSVIEYLLAQGTDINLKDAGGTPLYWAAFSGNAEIFRYLAARGARLDASDTTLSQLFRVIEEGKLDELTKEVQSAAQRESASKAR